MSSRGSRVTRHFILVLLAMITFTAVAGISAAAERQVKFSGAGGATLAGTLLVPDGDAAATYPAVVLLAGSGPTDRNGNQPPALIADLLKQIAEGLSRRGIASLRFDKRGMHANAAEMPKDAKLAADFFTWENFVGDAVAAVIFLREQPGVNRRQVGLLGHSEGGMLSLKAANILEDKKQSPAVLMLLGTPGRSMDLLLEDQLHTIMGKQKATPVQQGYIIAEHKRIVAAIKETSTVPGDVPPGLAALYPAYLGRFLHGAFTTDPAKLAHSFTGPVLVLNGGSDVQVSSERDAKALDAALKTRTADDHSLVIIEGASHNLKRLKSPEDAGITGEIDAAALTAITDWAAGKLGAALMPK